MKNKILFTILCLTLLLACTSKDLVDVKEAPTQEKEPVIEQGEVMKEETQTIKQPQKEEVKETTVKEAEPEEIIEEVKVQEVNTPDVQKILDRYDEKTTSYEFFYAPPPDNLARHRYFVLGDKIRIEVYEENYKMKGDYFDTVFLDLEKETAVAYCLKGDNILCELGAPIEQEFIEWRIKLPHEYLAEIEHAEKAGSETLYDRRTYTLKYTAEGMPHSTWIDEYSGVPLRVKIGDNKESPKWEFREVGINSVLEEDVTPPQ